MDLMDSVLGDLISHPESTAQEIADRIRSHSRDVFWALRRAESRGLCQRWRSGRPGSPWQWEIPTETQP